MNAQTGRRSNAGTTRGRIVKSLRRSGAVSMCDASCMRILWGIVFSVGSVFCAALFLLLAITKFWSGSWLMYACTLAFGLGALGCFKAATQYFANDPLDSMRR